MNAKAPSSENIVRARHRAARVVPALLVLSLGLGLTLGLLWLAHPRFAPVENWQHLGAGWIAGLALSAVGAMAFWRMRRRTLVRSAAEMDAVLEASNRLEAATALRNTEDALARAQREETERFLQQKQITPRQRAVPALSALTALLVFSHLATLVCWTHPAPPALAVKEAAPSPRVGQAPAAPSASIEWRSPEPETVATAIEEVPLEAEATSSTGLRDTALEIEVNGEHRLSQQLTNDLATPGAHSLKLSIYLDQLEVKTYDMVSYHLSARRISQASLPATTSPVQFIQIRPMREDTFVCSGGDQPSKCFNYVTALKTAQLRLMKENFALAHPEIDPESEEWRQENTRVGSDQNQLASRADEVIALMASNRYPEQILGLVRQSQPLMAGAGGQIIKRENQPALSAQGKALGLLTAVEKYLKHSIKLAGGSAQRKASDPFQRAKNLELKTHPLTRAGKIDALADEQARLAGDLAAGRTNPAIKLMAADSAPEAEPITGTPGERQAQIKKRIQDILNDSELEPGPLKHLQSSDELAGKSQDQIEQQDFRAASEPAAEAARELRQTAAALRTGGNQAAKNQLAAALLQLSAAAANVRNAAKAKSDSEASEQLKRAEEAVNEAAKLVAAEAQRLSGRGGGQAGERLGEMAKLLQNESLNRMQGQARQSPREPAPAEELAQRLDELAERAGRLRNSEQPTRQELSRAVERLKRAQVNLKHLASQCNNPSASGTASSGQERSRSPGSGAEQRQQFAEALAQELQEGVVDSMSAGSTSSELVHMRKILFIVNHNSRASTDQVVAFAAEIDPPLRGLITLLGEELFHYKRKHQLLAPDITPAPPAYRSAVADYFEQVSRDYEAYKPADEPNRQ